jgi:predicted metal-dependent hydrolase
LEKPLSGRHFLRYQDWVNKSQRIEELVSSLDLPLGGVSQAGRYHPCYLGYFECFNSQHYYEAHDVLEHLWLMQQRGARDYDFYKGLIQLAGGFVHLKLHHAEPLHPKHGRRLQPARRLFLRAVEHLLPYGEHYQGLDLIAPVTVARSFALLLEKESFSLNPWSPERAPRLPMPGGLD